MRTEYYGIYEDLLSRVQFGTGLRPRYRRPLPPLDLIAKIVDDAANEADIGERLRPDARYFLTINLYHMIVLPTSHMRAPRDAAVDLTNDLLRDTTMVLRAAGELTQQEVSGHMVLAALDRVWDRLALTAKDLWG